MKFKVKLIFAEITKAERNLLQKNTFFSLLLFCLFQYRVSRQGQKDRTNQTHLGTEQEWNRQEERQHSQKLQTPSNASFQAKVIKQD